MKDRLKELRTCLDLSMEKFGSKIGVTRSTISKLESGTINFTEQTLLSICREFRVNYFWLTEGIGEMFSGTPQTVVEGIAEDYNLDDIDKKIIEKYLDLPPEKRQVLKDFLKSIFVQ